MSNIHQLHPQQSLTEQRLEQACDWLAALDRGLSTAEQAELQQWLCNDPDNLSLFLSLAKTWDKMDQLSRLSDLFPEQSSANHNSGLSSYITKSRWHLAIAASLFAVMLLGAAQFVYPLFGTAHPSANVIAMHASYQTAIGETNVIRLPDNSKLTLNTNSFVQVKYTQNARIIELQRGEINIEVAHNKARPLSVIASGKVIQAVGTAFNVNLKAKLVELIVTNGRVLVADKPKADTSDNETLLQATQKLPESSVAVSKGEKADLSLTGQRKANVVNVDPADIAASLSWRTGNLIFRGESLQDAMAEISRYTNISFELANDEKLKQVKVAGMFKTGDVNGLLAVLQHNFHINHKRLGHNKIQLSYAG